MLDVVIPYHGRYDWLSVCLTALARMSTNPLRVILVDNASEPDGLCAPGSANTAALAPRPVEDKLSVLSRTLADLNPRMTVSTVRLGENKSFSHSVNAGVAHGTNKYVCVLNSDVVVTPGWDAILLTHLANDSCGLVGPRCNYARGPQGGGPKVAAPYLIFFCVAFRRALWDAIGPLDAETFSDWCGGEDLDYSWRVKESGYKLEIADFEVYHAGSQTYRSSQVAPEAQDRMHERAEARLEEKWGKESYRQHTHTTLDLRIGVGVLMIDRRIDYEYFRSMFDMLAYFSKERPGRVVNFCDVSRMSPGWARELIMKWAVETKHDYLLMIDDDMRFPPNFLSRLLSHEKDVVAGYAYKRKAPYGAVAYSWRQEEEGYVDLNGLERHGLVKVDAVGMGGVLIKVDMLKRMRTPYFRHDMKFGEDLGFCKRAMDEASAEIYVDTDLIMGHVGDPIVIDEGYVAAYKAAQQQKAARELQHEVVLS